ncbi:hypothetical protein B0H10DRAFT_2063907 [Mycena sp. CBHHK59/15]|nr:hypothetical protein B0H10DRAFT_2063907 [Mycena sp. CBHHK59/15]
MNSTISDNFPRLKLSLDGTEHISDHDEETMRTPTGTHSVPDTPSITDDGQSIYASSLNSEEYFSSPEADEELPEAGTPDREAAIDPTDNVVNDLPDIFSPAIDNYDLLRSVQGMYRVLDLISEPGSGGLVDKIIICQDSLQEFINVLLPGAYSSMTKVNFKALDNLSIKPLGLYGSKSEIVAFLKATGIIDEPIARALELSRDRSAEPHLRSGLYLVRALGAKPGLEQVFALYWPEDTTWNDNASAPVSRNRATFMRYLSKITDQVACLISSAHAQSIVWSNDSEGSVISADRQSNRFRTFKVTKANEQVESVTVRDGFKIRSPLLITTKTGAQNTMHQTNLKPILVAGEAMQALLTMQYKPAGIYKEPINEERRTPEGLRALMYDYTRDGATVRLGSTLSDDAVAKLMSFGLKHRYPHSFEVWNSRREEDEKTITETRRKDGNDMKQKVTDTTTKMEMAFCEAINDRFLYQYHSIRRPALSKTSDVDLDRLRTEFSKLIQVYHKVRDEMDNAMRSEKVANISPRSKFKSLKERLIYIDLVLGESQDLAGPDRRDLLRRLCQGEICAPANSPPKAAKERKGLRAYVSSFWRSTDKQADVDRCADQAQKLVTQKSDTAFINELRTVEEEPCHDALISQVQEMVCEHLRNATKKLTGSLIGKAITIQQEVLSRQMDGRAAQSREESQKARRIELEINMLNETAPGSRTLLIDAFHSEKLLGNDLYQVHGYCEHSREASIECQLFQLGLTAEDRQTLQRDPATIPSPQILPPSLSPNFVLSTEQRILHAQLLETGKVLLILEDPASLLIFLSHPTSLQAAICRGKRGALRQFYSEWLEKDLIIRYDESKRALLICEPTKFKIQLLEFDEGHTALQLKSPLELGACYQDYNSGVFVTHSCFVPGGEEILIVDSEKRARIYSLVTKQFRPASLDLEQAPVDACPSPDGACLILSFRCESGLLFRAYHWSTFGSSEGHDLGPLDLASELWMVSSLGSRRNVHLISIDTELGICQSSALDITKQDADFTFKETKVSASSKLINTSTVHNCLIDCHSDVWTRFPVVAAIQRQTIVSSGSRLARRLLFITDRDHDRFATHFDELIYSFEQRTRKPTRNELKNIGISALDNDKLTTSFAPGLKWDVSEFRAGEWLVDLLCLIPIQIAVTRENRFLPLKDGVISATLERQLLGAEVCQIVDAISIGWYESVLQSYMVSKPVKVVSSMGEQSVGKSFSLNHLVDTSFAGSAMRTTEGVWMSVTPTENELIVALDFEGVHSIERSVQEDTLLVLFNTAISNLVLFRNNFAMSRSIAGLFQSFQSSSTVLDPAANPQLFRSTLAIIIKDVVEADTEGIVDEFYAKFDQIVRNEQGANFITRLHGGDLDIIPWPVIESRQFYSLFNRLKGRLDEQEVTHPTAGEFLHTLKTLMAKLKANDWAALSETLAAHRGRKLRSCLSMALVTGFLEIDPIEEPLKNFDTDEVIDSQDTSSRFFLSAPEVPTEERQRMLATLQTAWHQFGGRHNQSESEWTTQLAVYLTNLAELRIQHVFEWISSNVSRFSVNHANMELLRRDFDSAAEDLRSNVEICRMNCASCDLSCLLSWRHGVNTPHDCGTSHRCPRSCDFGEEHAEAKVLCGYRAGHSGKHICVVDIHLCGETCVLQDKNGCMGACTKVSGHSEGDHMCSAAIHACGEPCCLKDVKSSGGINASYSCARTCVTPSHIVHDRHTCDLSSCPLPCVLCKRLCSCTDHLHGLQADSIHLCGQEHRCPKFCSAKGACQIETLPQSVEATFTGRHETFKYTKYSQVSNRLQCVIMIPSGEKEHTAAHTHSTEPTPFHFCETQCGSCGYYCTLPLGHPQKEHETHHGSMSKTAWAVDGPDGTILELQGHKFASNDDGAPMMCNLVCQEMGRHVHIAYCEANEVTSCNAPEVQHETTRLLPHPDRSKDWISHSLYWKRSGFKDPYSKDDQANFAKCDAICPGFDHAAGSPPSYCCLPIFHPKPSPGALLRLGQYLSRDGHIFPCKNPAELHKIFHIIFVIDQSSSMAGTDLHPLPGTPKSAFIAQHSNNRLGAVFSALHSFWIARDAVLNDGQRDACSVVFFNGGARICLENDVTSTPDELLQAVVTTAAEGVTSFERAISTAQNVMRDHWSTTRDPVVIFLSDGEGDISDETIRNLGRSAITLGKPLSFHSVLFGRDRYIGRLERMSRLALGIQNRAPVVGARVEVTVPSSFSRALSTVDLTQTFLDFAESLRKPRGSLLR